jgi:PAS domain S-box-containing protein
MTTAARYDNPAVFQELFAAYPDALLLVDAGGTVMLANPAAHSLLGYGADDLAGLSVDELVPDAVRDRHAAYRSAYAQAPRSRPMGGQAELVAKRRDGSEVLVEIGLSPLVAEGMPFVVAAIRGVEAYPRVRQALRRARYSDHVAQFGRLAVSTRDPQRLIEQAPRVAAEAMQVPHAMVYQLESDHRHFRVASGVGLVAQQPLGTRLPNQADTLPGFVVAQGRPFVVVDAQHTLDFTISPWYLEAGLRSAMAVPLADRDRIMGVLAVRAGKDQRFGEEEVRFLESLASLLATGLQRAQSDEALSHVQRLECVGQLTGGIAHDFNNLLTIISGNLQAVQDMPPVCDHPPSREMIEAAARAALRAADLTRKLLAFSRRQVLQPETVDIARLLHSLADMLRRTIDQRIHIVVNVEHDCPPCEADRTQLESAVLNLAINARDAMPDGGTLTFTAHEPRGLPVGINAKSARPAGLRFVEIAVADTGIGMSKAVMERAFEPFFTTKEPGRGTGMGLSTVYGFAAQSGGTVCLSSTPGQGTTVSLHLPALLEQRRADGSPASTPSVPAGLRVLMVEDEAEVRAVVHAFLTAIRCQAVACSTAEQAWALLAAAGEHEMPFDLLLTDVALGPGMRGSELAVKARRLWPVMPVLLMSGFASDLLGTPSEELLLRKPFDRDDLARAIAQALG